MNCSVNSCRWLRLVYVHWQARGYLHPLSGRVHTSSDTLDDTWTLSSGVTAIETWISLLMNHILAPEHSYLQQCLRYLNVCDLVSQIYSFEWMMIMHYSMCCFKYRVGTVVLGAQGHYWRFVNHHKLKRILGALINKTRRIWWTTGTRDKWVSVHLLVLC